METAGTSNLYCVGSWQYDSFDVKTEVVDRQGKTSRWAYSVDNMKLKNYSFIENVSSFSAKYYMGYTHASPEYGVF